MTTIAVGNGFPIETPGRGKTQSRLIKRIAQPNEAFNFESMDWDTYKDVRPSYPQSLYSLIFEFHGMNPLSRALDIGTGGVATVGCQLLPHFTHVTLSDPHPLYLEQARGVFTDTELTKLSFLEGKIEDMTANMLSQGPVDMLTAGTCMHWADHHKVASSAARLLKSGGTFAAWTYGTRVRLVVTQTETGQGIGLSVGPRVQAAYNRLVERFFELYQKHISPIDTEDHCGARLNSRYDCIGFDMSKWRNVTRIYDVPEEYMAGAEFPTARSSNENEVAERLLIGEGTLSGIKTGLISKEVGCDGLIGYYVTLSPPLDMSKNSQEVIDGMRQAMKDDGIARVRMEWTFAMVLATRR